MFGIDNPQKAVGRSRTCRWEEGGQWCLKELMTRPFSWAAEGLVTKVIWETAFPGYFLRGAVFPELVLPHP